MYVHADQQNSYRIGHRDARHAAAELALKADAEIDRLKSILRQQIIIYQVDDQAWNQNESADKIMTRLLAQ
jgi:hypothetical protein